MSKDRLRGIRIFDITDIANPKYVANVQTCRGSHTHTVVTDPKDKENVYIYVSGSARRALAEELPGCKDATDRGSEHRAVPHRSDQGAARGARRRRRSSARRASSTASAPRRHDRVEPPRRAAARRDGARRDVDRVAGAVPAARAAPLLDSLTRAAAGRADGGRQRGRCGAGPAARRDGRRRRRGRHGPARTSATTSRSIRRSASPAARAAATACCSTSATSRQPDAHRRGRRHQHVVLALGDVQQRRHQGACSPTSGAAAQPRCRATDKPEWGANALFTIENGKMEFKSYYKLPAPQTSFENCVAHNGSLIPIPGRDVMVQGWYQGGISVFDWTDVSKPKEIAFFDRGPVDATRMVSGGSWSVYWYNGVIVSSEIARGLDTHRNGTSGKTVLTDDGPLPIEVPRDREGTFEPRLIGKHERRFTGFDDKILALYARGMTVREIQAFLAEMYAVEVSPDLISTVTDAVVAEVTAWQSRPLDPMYPVVFFDALRVKIRDEGDRAQQGRVSRPRGAAGREPGYPRNLDRANGGREILDAGLHGPENTRLPGHPHRGDRWPQRDERGAGGGVSGDDAADLYRPSDSSTVSTSRIGKAEADGGRAATIYTAPSAEGPPPRSTPWSAGRGA